jgi:hypothetical protein
MRAWIAVGALLCAWQTDARSVNGLELSSPQAPPIRLTVQPGFRYLGRVEFSLGSVARGERFVFADAKDSLLRRMVIVQFEGMIPSNPDIYHYDLRAGREMGSLRFVQNTFAFPGTQQMVETPENEADHTNNFLLSQGFRIPAVWLVNRYVTIATADRKNEMIVFYMEGSDSVSLSDLYTGDEPTLLWQRLRAEVASRSSGTFTIEDLPGSGP